MARQLKVYRTVAGFHDAYVAAPSQKAALAAWGSDKDLFARGDAERVDDPDLMAAPLADPGTVIRLSRGTTAAQIAAMPDIERRQRPPQDDGGEEDGNDTASTNDGPPRAAKKRIRVDPTPPPAAPKPPRSLKPGKERLIAAEDALDEAGQTQRAERRDLAKREADLARDRQTMERRHHAADERLQRALDEAKTAYDAAMTRWKA